MLILHSLHSIFSYVVPFVILLGLLVFVHELGHFLVAKWCGVRVEVFSLGFGKKIFKRQYGDTVYALSLIPLGGYVKMFGDNPQMEIPPEEREKSFLHKPLGQRVAVVLAGPLMNLFFAFFLFTFIGFVGDRQPAAVLGDIAATSVAYQDGFRSGDKIVSINDQHIQGWSQVSSLVAAATDQPLRFEVTRAGEKVEVTATPVSAPNENIFSADASVGQIEGLSFESDPPFLGVAREDAPAYLAGLRNLDLVTQINGKDVATFRDFEKIITAAKEPLRLKVQSYMDGKLSDDFREISLPAGKSLSELGIEYASTYILQIKEKSPAANAGLLAGDKVLSIQDNPVKNWMEIMTSIKDFDPAREKTIKITVARNGKTSDFQITPEMTDLTNPMNGKAEHRFTIGILSSNFKVGPETVLYHPEGILGKFTYGMQQTWQWTEFTVMSIVRVFQGTVSANNIGGVITIGRVASHSFEAGLSVFLKTMAIISINLFLLNLLPVPVLDGGHLVFFAVEAVKGSPMSLRKLEIAQQIGLTLLLLLMAFALYNDVNNAFFSAW
jgi:regulator of sigma E protease